MRSTSRADRRQAFTLLELLTVIAIIGALVALLLPAIQAAREAARQATCRNHLKQMALGALIHHDQQGHFPTGGWSSKWTGDPDRGFRRRQPGGWAYNLLPFIDQEALYSLGAGQSLDDKVAAIKTRDATPVPEFFCPSRRAPVVFSGTEDVRDTLAWYYNASDAAWAQQGKVSEYAPMDYVANGTCLWGDRHEWSAEERGTWGAPRWSKESEEATGWRNSSLNAGVIYQISLTRIEDVWDGASNTYLFAESSEFFELYDTIWVDWRAHGLPEYGAIPYRESPSFVGAGFSNGPNCCEAYQPTRDRSVSGFDAWDLYWARRYWGSAHSSGFHAAMCDGSVRRVAYDVALEVHQMAADRADEGRWRSLRF